MSSEQALIRGVVDRHPGAEAEFLACYRGLMEGLAAGRFALPREEVLEVVQETIVRLWNDDFKALRAWRGEGRFTTYLTVIVSRLCLERRRRSARPEKERSREVFETDAIAEPDEEDAVLAAERARAVSEALAALSPRDRLLLTLRHRDDREPARIARLLGLRPGTCRKALHDAGKRLRRTLEREHPEIFSRAESKTSEP